MRKHISYGNVVATLALFLVLGGTALAAKAIITKPSQRGKGVVTNQKVKKGTLKANRLSKKARQQLKGNRGPQGEQGPQGEKGEQGAQGAQGPAGTARGFAELSSIVVGGDTVRDANSENITDAMVTHPASGVWCFNGLPFDPKLVIGNVLRGTGGTPPGDVFTVKTLTEPEIPLPDHLCPGSEQASLLVFNDAGNLANPLNGVAVLFE